MRRHRKWMIVGGTAALACYVLAYAYLRITHRIVHFQNKGGEKQIVVAPSDPWDDLLVDMSQGRPVADAYARILRRSHGALNAIFWPLRAIEAAYWNRKTK